MEIRIRNESEVKIFWKTDKIWQFLNENAQYKNIKSFLSKIISLKSFILLQSNTFTRRDYKGKNYVKNIRKTHVGSETGSGSESRYRSGPSQTEK